MAICFVVLSKSAAAVYLKQCILAGNEFLFFPLPGITTSDPRLNVNLQQAIEVWL